MIKTNFGRIILVVSLLVTGCSSFIPDEDVERITLKYQAGEYVLLQDLNRNNIIFPKNSPVKLIVLAGDDWVKVYVYNSSEELLASKRLILLHMFETDFPEEKFNQELFETELAKLIKFKDPSESTKKENRKETKKDNKKETKKTK